MLNIHPKFNLIKNLGFGKNATHTKYPKVNLSLRFGNSKISKLEPKLCSKYDYTWERKQIIINLASMALRK
jgi:hypothetical protein